MDLIAIKSDLAFRAVFGRESDKCKQALIALLNDVLDLRITKLRYINSFEDDKMIKLRKGYGLLVPLYKPFRIPYNDNKQE